MRTSLSVGNIVLVYDITSYKDLISSLNITNTSPISSYQVYIFYKSYKNIIKNQWANIQLLIHGRRA